MIINKNRYYTIDSYLGGTYMNEKVRVARLSIFSNTALIFMKLFVGLFTGSVSVISEAIHSAMDLVAAIIAFFSVRISDKPADKHHPYGHGKVENVSGVVEALLIVVASIWIIVEAIKKIISPSAVESIGLGFIVMFIAAGINFLVSKKLYKVAMEVDSIALEADALHLKADVYTSLGVGAGLLLISITKIHILDPIAAILVAIFILKEAIELLLHAFNPLLDSSLNDEDITVVRTVLNKYSYIHCDFHDIKGRKSGNKKYIDLKLLFPKNMTVLEAHDVCDKIEEEIETALKNTQVMIHIESCDEQCDNCKTPKNQV